jgi:hypothetical protein
MNGLSRCAVVAVALVAAACSNAVGTDDTSSETSSTATVSERITDSELNQRLAAVRQATDKYHDVNVALAEGFQNWNGPYCEPNMGYHFVNVGRVLSPPSETAPSILLYDNDPSTGGYNLVGVEYMVPVIVNGAPYYAPKDVPPPPDAVKNTPRLFDRNFDGPMPGHSPAMPWHWDLHVYVWRANPKGIFTPLNPTVCR